MFTEDLAVYFDTEDGFAEYVVVNGSVVPAIVDYRTTLALGNDVLVPETSLLIRSSDAVGVAEAQAATVRGAPYVIRQVMAEPSDGAVTRVILARS